MSPYGALYEFLKNFVRKPIKITNKVSTGIFSLFGRAKNHILYFWQFLLESAKDESEKLMGTIGDHD